MRPDTHDSAWLWDMLKFAREVEAFARGKSFEEYLGDLMLRRASERSVLVIGKAASKVSDEFRTAHPEVPWRAIVVQRHRLVHDYDEIIDERIWEVAATHVPVLIEQIGRMLPEPPPDPLPEESA